MGLNCSKHTTEDAEELAGAAQAAVNSFTWVCMGTLVSASVPGERLRLDCSQTSMLGPALVLRESVGTHEDPGIHYVLTGVRLQVVLVAASADDQLAADANSFPAVLQITG